MIQHWIQRLGLDAIWGWAAVALFVLSVTIGNLYRLAPPGDYMVAVRIFVVSVILLAAIYSLLLLLREPRWTPRIAVVCSLLTLALSLDVLADVDSYDSSLKSFVWLWKIVTAIAAIGIFLTFDRSQLFERATWICLVGLECYSAVQYPLCKIAPSGILDLSEYLSWGDPLAKSACSRAFGPMMAYADVVICAVLLVVIVVRWVHAGRAAPSE